jgi:hypothetical protein
VRWTPGVKLAAITKAQFWFNCGTVGLILPSSGLQLGLAAWQKTSHVLSLPAKEADRDGGRIL